MQLITDISVNPNNLDDSQILNERVDKMKEKTPELNEMHTDGGYGSEDNDKKFEELKINQITTAVNDRCRIFKNKGRYYFTHEDFLQNRRNRNIMNIPEERRKIRPNVEALMNEFKIRTPGGKLKVRGLFKATLFAFNTGIAINFGRIYRLVAQNRLTEEFDPSIPTVLSVTPINWANSGIVISLFSLLYARIFPDVFPGVFSVFGQFTIIPYCNFIFINPDLDWYSV